MKTFNLKNKVIVAIAALGFAVSVNAASPETSYEQAVQAYIVVQSQQVMQELSTSLQNNIETQLQQFNVDQAVSWFNDISAKQTAKVSEKSAEKENTTTED